VPRTLGSRLLIERGAHIEATDKDGQTVLHAAARKDYSLTDLLLNHGADANVADKHGSTPLHIAIQEDCDGSMVNLLIVSVPGRKGCRQYLDYDREKRLKGKERKEDATTAAQPSTGVHRYTLRSRRTATEACSTCSLFRFPEERVAVSILTTTGRNA
jgi:ankyrin repeat protein